MTVPEEVTTLLELPSVSAVVCAYTEERWPLIQKAIASLQDQSCPPAEIILCIDHNDRLLERCEQRWQTQDQPDKIPVQVVANKYDGHLGSARNTAAELACGEVLAFLDDDAAAEPDWLERLLAPYADPSVVAVGGAPMPLFEGPAPRWFPAEFYWVFGCAYSGLPETTAPVAHLIGANMSVRRQALADIGGFHSDDHDDMDMCHRLAFSRHSDAIVYEPSATVRHFVPVTRTTWRYFRRRCYYVNRGKVEAFDNMGGAAHLDAELSFVAKAMTRGVWTGIAATFRGDPFGIVRSCAIVSGVVLAGAGHVSGRVAKARRRRP